MKRILVTVLAVFMVLSLFTACAPSADNSTPTDAIESPSKESEAPAEESAPAEAPAAEPVKIGINMELSGSGASYGEETVKGIEMAIEEINAAGGINGAQVELVKYDNKTDAAESTTLATKLMTEDKVLAILGPATTGAFKAQIPVAIQNQIPVITGSATADDVVSDASGVKEYAFRICFNDSYQGTAMANFAFSNLSKSKAVIIKDNSNDYSKGLAVSFNSAFTEIGGTIVADK